MSVNILIGVGGTGAKVVESCLMLFAAGIGPEEVHVGMVDQDQANGNVGRSHDFLRDLMRLRQLWGEQESAHYLDWQSADDPIDFGSVTVKPLFPDRNSAIWCPERDNTNLAGIIGENLDPPRQALFDCLFMRGDEEQDLMLGKGYRGRAHVGATALVASIIEEESELLARLRTLMEDPGQRDVNIFIVGSAFGGTGAAGFPTLARALNRLRSDRELANRNNIHIGGLLMLPYFSFNDDEGDGEAVVTSDELIPKAQLALEYYANLFRNEQAFDRFYALGWERMIPLGYHEAGAAEQSNPALPPELFAASSAVDFFNGDGANEADGTQILLSARQDNAIKWRDLPGADLIQNKLAQLLRFAFYWRYIARGMLDEKPGMLRKNWMHKLVGKIDLTSATNQLDALDSVLHDVLHWAATIQRTGERHWSPGPWDLSNAAQRTEDPTKPVSMLTSPSKDVYDCFDELMFVDGGQVVPRTGHHIYSDLDGGNVALRNKSKGIGVAVATVAKAMNVGGGN
jgi:hypothetical protein